AEVAIRQGEQQRQQRQAECTTAKVALAQVEERLTALEARHRQVETDLGQRRQEQTQGERHLGAAAARLAESQRTMLQASAVIAAGYLDKEVAERRLGKLTSRRDEQRQERQVATEKAQSLRAAWRIQQEQAHARELQVNDL